MKSFHVRLLVSLFCLCTLSSLRGEEQKSSSSPPALADLTAAAEKGDAKAQLKLGQTYHDGEGVSQDFAAALKWFHEAARQGDNEAQYQLGLMYQRGESVPQDFIRAHKWLNLAATGGHSKAAEARDSLAKSMSQVQVAAAQREAALFVERRQKQREGGGESKSAHPEFGNPKSSGTGFFITPDGYLLTSFHVVKGASEIKVRTAEGLVAAKVVQSDPVNDIAILKSQGVFKPLSFGSSRSLKLGDSVFTVGFPNPGMQGVEPKFTRGEVSSLAGIKDDPRHLQISVAVQPGNSGGALVDLDGNVVGVIESRLPDMKALKASGMLPQNVNYALKSAYVTAFLESLPAVIANLREQSAAKGRKFDEVVKEVQQSTALILAY